LLSHRVFTNLLKEVNRVVGENLLAVSIYGDACARNDFIPGISEIDVVIVTREIIDDLCFVNEQLNKSCAQLFDSQINFHIIPDELFKTFYIEGIYPAVLAVHSNCYLYNEKYFRELRKVEYKNDRLAINYSLCSGLYRISKAIECLTQRNYKCVIRNLYYSAKFSLSALIHKKLRKLPICNDEITSALNRIRNCGDIRRAYADILEACKSSGEVNAKHHRHYTTIHDQESVLRISDRIKAMEFYFRRSYLINRRCWELIYGEDLLNFDEFLNLLEARSPIDIELLCLDDEPVAIFYIGREEEERIKLFKKRKVK